MLSKCFGHTYSGAWYSDYLLTVIRHYHNWRASIRNRPGFPKLRHYDGQAIDKINELCFSKPKYRNWISTNDSLPPMDGSSSPFGIEAIETTSGAQTHTMIHANKIRTVRTSHDYIALRQGSDIAYLPVKGKEENILFCDFMQEAIRDESSLASTQTFATMSKRWNERALGKVNSIFKKLPIHLAQV